VTVFDEQASAEGLTPAWGWVDEPIFAEREAEVAFEIAFLEKYDVPLALLFAATHAARCGVAADQALLGEGLMREEEFYRLLARHLRAPYYRGEIKIGACRDPAETAARGMALLAPNALGLRYVLAPRGAALTSMLRAADAGRLKTPFAVTSPQRLGAVIRFQMGRQVAEEAAGALERADAALSAHTELSNGQLGAAYLLMFCATFLGELYPESTQATCAVALWIVFASAIALRFATVAAWRTLGASPPPDIDELPVYSIIAPLYREAKIAPQLIEALDAIDYPKSKLDIKIVVEKHDIDTLTALARMRLPSRYDIVVAPAGRPATKPRALNIALPSVRGELVVVYDAEDIPAPDQLRRAAARFARDKDVDCLQARLAIDNIDDSWLTRLFAIEYAALFDVVNPGLAALGAPMALGGTSNHFRTQILRRIGGWDAWNVTEDADLGLRLARFGRRVATLDSDTYEEAPAHLTNWFGQRRRWLKGWLQTLAVHLRNPRRLVRELGLVRALAAQTLLFGAVLGGLLGPPLLAYALWRCVTGELFKTQTTLQTIGNAMTLVLMLSGFGAMLTPIVLALRVRGLQRLYWFLPLLPLYYGLVWLAAWAALVDAVARPSHWSKTEHGLARASIRASRHIGDRRLP
jgi:cellulose synthase/poly-beta-1,6-N-acetylglucosamine synthase-like glycosyltransferase